MFFDLPWRREKRLRPSRSERHSAKRGPYRARKLSLESLEDRRVLSAGPAALWHAAAANLRVTSSLVAPAATTPSDTNTALTVSVPGGTAGSSAETNYAQPVTLTATVSPVNGGTATFKRGDTVEFFDNLPGGAIQVIARARVSSAGVATTVVSNLPVNGSPHSITAKFDGDPSLNSSTSTAVTVTIDQADSTTTVFAHPNPSVLGQNVTFVAVVTPATLTNNGSIPIAGDDGDHHGDHGGRIGRPSGGNVDFFLDGSTTPIVVVANSWGVATYSTNSLTLGPHMVYAVYEGDPAGNPNFKASPPSSTVTQQVVSALTSTRLTASPRHFSADGAVTFTATVALRGGATFDASKSLGSVDFLDGGTLLGTVAITPAMLDTTGTKATLTFTPTSNLLIGVHGINAKYSGSGTDYGASTGYLVYWVGTPPWAWGKGGSSAHGHAHDDVFADWHAMSQGLAMGPRW